MVKCEKGKLLINCINLLEKSGVKTCLLHGYRSFPDVIPSDVDMLALAKDHSIIQNLFSQNENALGARLINAIKYESTSVCYIFCKKDVNKKYIYLRLDISVDYRGSGQVFLTGEEIIKSRQRYKNFWVPSPKYEFIYYFIKKVLKRHINKKTNVRVKAIIPHGFRRL